MRCGVVVVVVVVAVAVIVVAVLFYFISFYLFLYYGSYSVGVRDLVLCCIFCVSSFMVWFDWICCGWYAVDVRDICHRVCLYFVLMLAGTQMA